MSEVGGKLFGRGKCPGEGNMSVGEQMSYTHTDHYTVSVTFRSSVVRDRSEVRYEYILFIASPKRSDNYCQSVRDSVEKKTRSLAVTERPRDASCHWIFRYVTQSHSRSFEMTLLSGAWHVYKSLLVFHWNYVCISYRFWYIQRQIMAWPWNQG